MSDLTGKCRECGTVTSCRDSMNPTDSEGNPRFECPDCKKARERAYDDYVDPLHVYH